MGRVIGTHHNVSRVFKLCTGNCLNEQLLLGLRFFDIVYTYKNGEFRSLSPLYKTSLREMFETFIDLLSIDNNTIFIRLTPKTESCISDFLESYAKYIVPVSSSSLQPQRRRGKILLFTEVENPCHFYIHSSPFSKVFIHDLDKVSDLTPIQVECSCEDLQNEEKWKKAENLSICVILTNYKPKLLL